MAGGIYNHTYFENYPEEKEREGVLYGIVLVNTKRPVLSKIFHI